MLLAIGEIMLRIAPPGFLRFTQAMPGSVETSFAGAEANVCASLAMFGRPTRLVTVLPKNPIADAAVASLRALGIDTCCVVRSGAGRLGIYYVETGANQRSSTVVYDRDHSAFSLAVPSDYPLEAAFQGITRLHITGISPSLSEAAFQTTLAFCQRARQAGVQVSCDLNFRAKLWRWKPGTPPRQLAGECMRKILPFVDLLIANEEDAADVLNIHAQGTAIEQGKINAAAYHDVAAKIVAEFPNLKHVAITLRESLSASHNNWGGMLYEAASAQAYFAPMNSDAKYQPYEIKNIVDRVGAGDSFAAGLIHAFESSNHCTPQLAIQFAVANSCLKHSIQGDFNFVTLEEVEALAKGLASGRVRR